MRILLKITLLHVTLHEIIEYRVHSPLVNIVVVTDQPEAFARLLLKILKSMALIIP